MGFYLGPIAIEGAWDISQPWLEARETLGGDKEALFVFLHYAPVTAATTSLILHYIFEHFRSAKAQGERNDSMPGVLVACNYLGPFLGGLKAHGRTFNHPHQTIVL